MIFVQAFSPEEYATFTLNWNQSNIYIYKSQEDFDKAYRDEVQGNGLYVYPIRNLYRLGRIDKYKLVLIGECENLQGYSCSIHEHPHYSKACKGFNQGSYSCLELKNK
jgi:hypothetical protein